MKNGDANELHLEILCPSAQALQGGIIVQLIIQACPPLLPGRYELLLGCQDAGSCVMSDQTVSMASQQFANAMFDAGSVDCVSIE